MAKGEFMNPRLFLGRPGGRFLTSEDQIREKILLILGETWAYKVQGPVESMGEELDWVKNNLAIMANFEKNFLSACGCIRSTLLEKLQYRCDRCEKTTTIGESHFVSIDDEGNEDCDFFPECICKECGEAFDEFKDENYHRSIFS